MAKQHKCTGKVLPLVFHPDKRLKQVSNAVSEVDDSLRAELDDMIHALHHYEGVGLAGVQVGIMKDIFIVDVDHCLNKNQESKTDNTDMKGIYSMINAKIIEKSKEDAVYEEGCLSLPGLDYPKISRPAEIKVQYLNYDGNECTTTVRGLLAACIQHEMDHCEGKLIFDHLSPLKRQMQMRKVEKFIKEMHQDH